MRVISYPDFSAQESNAVIAHRKKEYELRVEIGLKSFVDYNENLIRIKKGSKKEMKIHFHHEIEHLYKPNILPIYSGERRTEEAFSTLFGKIKNGMEKLDEDSRNVINFFIKSLLVMAPYTPDNFLEDFLIEEHLKKEHGIESREIERLFSSVISEKDIFKFINSVKNLSEKNENLKILGFKSTIENAPILMSDKLDKSKLKSIIQNFREVVNYIYFLGDWAFCSSMGIDLEEYYKKKIREMLDRKRKFSNAKTIFKEAIYYRFQLELNRLNHFKAMAQKLILFNSIL